MPPRLRIRLIGKSQRQIGQRADVHGNDAELFGAVDLDRAAELAETRIVDDVLDLDARSGKCCGDLVAGIGLFEIAGNDDRRRAASGDDLARQLLEAIGAPRHQGNPMTVRREYARQFGAYARRGTGNQRHAISHDFIALEIICTMWRPAFATDHRP